MDKNIWVGVIGGLIFSTSLYVWNSKSFTKTQKTVLLVFFIFFPLQWIGIIACLIYNNYKENNTEEKTAKRKTAQKTRTLNSKVESLKDLKEKGILTEDEYSQKVFKIEQEKTEENLKNSQEYKQLKNLFDSSILTKEEFENKVNLLKQNIFTNSNNEKEKRIIFCKIDNKTYKISNLENEIKNGNLVLWRNTMIELEDGRKSILEFFPELSHLIEIVNKYQK